MAIGKFWELFVQYCNTESVSKLDKCIKLIHNNLSINLVNGAAIIGVEKYEISIEDIVDNVYEAGKALATDNILAGWHLVKYNYNRIMTPLPTSKVRIFKQIRPIEVAKSTTELIAKSTDKSTTESTDKSTTESTDKSTTESTDKSITGSTDKSITGSTDKSITEATTGSTDKSITEATTGSTDKSITEPIEELVVLINNYHDIDMVRNIAANYFDEYFNYKTRFTYVGFDTYQLRKNSVLLQQILDDVDCVHYESRIKILFSKLSKLNKIYKLIKTNAPRSEIFANIRDALSFYLDTTIAPITLNEFRNQYYNNIRKINGLPYYHYEKLNINIDNKSIINQ